MQDFSSGQMRELRAEHFKNVPVIEGLLMESLAKRQAIQAALDEIQPDRAKQGPVFEAGEILEIRGGRFRLEEITTDGLRLKGLPKL